MDEWTAISVGKAGTMVLTKTSGDDDTDATTHNPLVSRQI
jgi:hypothetical protein